MKNSELVKNACKKLITWKIGKKFSSKLHIKCNIHSSQLSKNWTFYENRRKNLRLSTSLLWLFWTINLNFFSQGLSSNKNYYLNYYLLISNALSTVCRLNRNWAKKRFLSLREFIILSVQCRMLQYFLLYKI